MCIDLPYYASYNHFASELTSYTTFLPEVEYNICLLSVRVLTGVAYPWWVVFDTIIRDESPLG